jgi:hypothetical protein
VTNATRRSLVHIGLHLEYKPVTGVSLARSCGFGALDLRLWPVGRDAFHRLLNTEELMADGNPDRGQQPNIA